MRRIQKKRTKPRRYKPDVDNTYATLASPAEDVENPDWLVGSN